MDSPDDACGNAEFLLQVLDEVTLSIFLSVDACPRYFSLSLSVNIIFDNLLIQGIFQHFKIYFWLLATIGYE